MRGVNIIYINSADTGFKRKCTLNKWSTLRNHLSVADTVYCDILTFFTREFLFSRKSYYGEFKGD